MDTMSIDVDMLQHALAMAQTAVTRSDLDKVELPRDFWFILSEFSDNLTRQSTRRNRSAAAAGPAGHHNRHHRLPTCRLFRQVFPNGEPPPCHRATHCKRWDCYYKHPTQVCMGENCPCSNRHVTMNIPDELPADKQIVSAWVTRTTTRTEQSDAQHSDAGST